LSHNKLAEFPKVLLQLQQLRHLDLRENKLTALPKEIGGLKNLEVIYLAGNSFTKEQRVEYRAWLPKTKIVWSDGKTVAE
jgi:Leucine-rich repeat (LRR) protein